MSYCQVMLFNSQNIPNKDSFPLQNNQVNMLLTVANHKIFIHTFIHYIAQLITTIITIKRQFIRRSNNDNDNTNNNNNNNNNNNTKFI